MQIKLKQKSENIRKMKQLQMMRKIIYNKLANRQDPEHRMQPAHPGEEWGEGLVRRPGDSPRLQPPFCACRAGEPKGRGCHSGLVTNGVC